MPRRQTIEERSDRDAARQRERRGEWAEPGGHGRGGSLAPAARSGSAGLRRVLAAAASPAIPSGRPHRICRPASLVARGPVAAIAACRRECVSLRLAKAMRLGFSVGIAGVVALAGPGWAGTVVGKLELPPVERAPV